MKRICQICGKEFNVAPSRIPYRTASFCSITCRGIGHRKTNVWREISGGIEIELTCGVWAIADAEDLIKLMSYKWFACWSPKTKSYEAHSYTRGVSPTKQIRMSRLVMDAPQDMLVDHINHDTLDNRKKNLRICTNSDNMKNVRIRTTKKSSRFKGVSWDKRRSYWTAFIRAENKHLYLGRFRLEIDAARAYNVAALKYYGEFAYINDISEGET